jgi:TPR repeat protein
VAGHQEAVHILRRFAETGHATSCVKLAHVYVYGRGVPTDLKQAEHWLRKGAATGAPLARFHLADLLLGEAPTRETILWAAGEFEHLAYSYGLNEAVRALGQVAFCFENDVSPLLMEQWLTHSAPLGDVQQFIILAELFLGQRPAGDAILDRTRGLFWLQAAAETDNVNAMRRLAFELLRGHPSARDPAGGVALLTSAATLGDVDAVTVLA